MEAQRTYTFDEFFPTLFKVPYIKRQTPESLIQLRVKLSVVCASGVFIVLLSFLMTIYKYNFQRNELSECLASSVGGLIVFYRECTFIVKSTKIRQLLANLEAIFPHNHDDQKCYRLHDLARKTLRKNNTTRFLISNGCHLMVLIPICKSIFYQIASGGDYEFLYPFITWNPFGRSNFVGYAVVYCFQVVIIYCSAYIWLKEDVIIVTSVAQLCMHYRYLGERLTKLDARKGKESSRELARLVRYQYNLDSICNDINDIYSFCNFVAFAFTRIFACMFLFSIINSNDFLKMPAFALDIFALTFSIFLRCSIGMELFDASSNLLYSIYDHNWYEGTPRHRKTILIMMIKANRPMNLQAFKLKTISMEYFKEIIVSTYEIFMFLYNVTK